MNEQRRVNAPAVACVVIAILLPAVYVGGYFALSVRHSGATPDDWCRIFRSQWLVEIYKPAARMESVLTGGMVSTYWEPGEP